MLLPRAYGGDEVDLGTWFRAMEALAKLDASTAWCVGQINGCAARPSALEPAVARKIWGEPRAALSWGPPIKARADEVDGGHRLSGEWMMSSGSRHATWIGLMAPVFDGAVRPFRCRRASTARIFFVPAERGRVDRQLGRHRPQRHQQRRLQGREPVRARKATPSAGSICPTCASPARSTSFPSTACSRPASPASRSASPAPCWMPRLRSPGEEAAGGQVRACARTTSCSSRSARPRPACARRAATSRATARARVGRRS